jgi:hypothetical protein
MSYTDNTDGTVTDNCTGLVWEQAAAPGENWNSAVDRCALLALAGNFDWRLPNVRELETLANYGVLPALDPLFDAPSTYYWSSTDRQADIGVWVVEFDTGSSTVSGTTATWRSRCVRGGI